jgi:diaminopropionate ammonia-lyase
MVRTQMLTSSGFRLFENPRAARTAPYGTDGREAILSLAALAEAKRDIMSWPGYKPTPLHLLPNLAAPAGVDAILYKDEAERFGLGSFKALGGAYAWMLRRRAGPWFPTQLMRVIPISRVT